MQDSIGLDVSKATLDAHLLSTGEAAAQFPNSTVGLRALRRWIIFSTWQGFDEMDEVRGDGSAELDDTAPSKSKSASILATKPSSKHENGDFFSRLLMSSEVSGARPILPFA